jgi:RNA polymerase sigma factor (sigma-70 family)
VTPPSLDVRIESLLRELAPQVLGSVIRRYRDFAAAEDAVQEALIAAAVQWPRDGLPDNPRGWLIQVASRRMADHWRSETARRRREEAAARDALIHPAARSREAFGSSEEDDTLVLLFMCCHPSLTPSSAIALTLRAVGGLTTAEVANAFLVPETTMAQRISRAKETVRSSGVAFGLPTPSKRAGRLGAVLHVLYLIFNEGYTTSAGSTLHRADLSSEAIRLTRVLHRVLPNDAEVTALLALMLLTDARRPARTDADGALIPLDEQDRSLWNKELIAEGVELVSAALRTGPVGLYQVQAAIAAIHDEAERFDDTDWPQILAFYLLLEGLSDNPMVLLSRVVATAMVEGPQAGLAALDAVAVDRRLQGHYRLDAVRAHLLEKAGDPVGAMAHYRAAAARTSSVPERNYLVGRAARLDRSR